MNAAVNWHVRDDEVIVVGSGVAGMVCALSLAPRRVTLITKTPELAGGSSYLAKGGIAAAMGEGDSPQQHAEDTLAAGAGLSDPERARVLAEDGIRYLQFLIDQGVPFDRALDGSLALAREAAHRHARVLHAGGDATGQVLVSSLAGQVLAAPSIEVLGSTFACDLVVERGQVTGLVSINPERGMTLHRTHSVVLATGGTGMTWWHTSNPPEATGDGLAIAARAGAALADLEFVQFHPTALAIDVRAGGASLPLLTEALRGAGALLLDEQGRRFMLEEAPEAELATRDVVARAIHRRTSAGQRVCLDLRPIFEAGRDALFPQAMQAAREAGYDPSLTPLPVIPAAHYHMGGIEVDANGRSSLAGLWACGEAANTGVHGANRLASNSLLEGLVCARQVATDVAHSTRDWPLSSHSSATVTPMTSGFPRGSEIASMHRALRRLMSRHVGIVRTRSGLETARRRLRNMDATLRANSVPLDPGRADSFDRYLRYAELRNALTVARMVTVAAMQREESRGAHYRHDFPISRVEWQRRQRLTLGSTGGSSI
ncbi:MAG TPA: L-aspartate oxidase [Woeseiaceae bacterium]